MSSDQGTHAGSNEFNKIAGAVLGTLLFTMAIGIASNAIFTVATPAKPGYDLPSAAAAAAAPAPAAKAVPIAQLLAKADPKKGEALSVVCKACHNVAKGGTAMVGPPLWDVVNR
ncbi:MAG: cytochrome c family protein, partial [Hyphomicrobiales bacterium]|nr:cytochrome c family protein [Hyphomicrobiales bacterium]